MNDLLLEVAHIFNKMDISLDPVPSQAIASAAVPSEQCGAFCLGTIDCKAFDWFQGTWFAYSATTGILSNVGWMCGYREFLEKEAQN